MSTTTATSPAELVTSLPKLSHLGPGRTRLVQAFGAELVTLPGPAVAALEGIARCERERHSLVLADPGIAHADYTAAVVRAIAEGDAVPEADLVVEMERRARVQGLQLNALTAATDSFVNRLEAALANGEALVVEHLRPALTKRYAQARSLLDEHGPALAGPAEAVVTAPAALGKAWATFGKLATEVSTLRTVQADVSIVERDEGDFLMTPADPRDPRLWGAGYGARHRTAQRPWPTDPRGYLGWLLSSGLPVWVPTGRERDARWEEVFGKPTGNLSRVGGPGDDVNLR